jgi:hypothetical protein
VSSTICSRHGDTQGALWRLFRYSPEESSPPPKTLRLHGDQGQTQSGSTVPRPRHARLAVSQRPAHVHGKRSQTESQNLSLSFQNSLRLHGIHALYWPTFCCLACMLLGGSWSRHLRLTPPLPPPRFGREQSHQQQISDQHEHVVQ